MRNLREINASRRVTKHPAEKPDPLLDRIIGAGSQKGDWMLDPLMGSGTTGVVSKRLGRNFHGFELDAGHFAESKKRSPWGGGQGMLTESDPRPPRRRIPFHPPDEDERWRLSE